MNDGKYKCEVLKSIRRRVAEELGIDFHPAECPHETCQEGVCPVCQQEADTLMKLIKEHPEWQKKLIERQINLKEILLSQERLIAEG